MISAFTRLEAEFYPGIIIMFKISTYMSFVIYITSLALRHCHVHMCSAYDNKEYSSEAQFPDATLEQRRISFSHWLNFPPSTNLSACASYTLKLYTYPFFVPEFWRILQFSKASTVKMSGITLHRLEFNSCKNLYLYRTLKLEKD